MLAPLEDSLAAQQPLATLASEELKAHLVRQRAAYESLRQQGVKVSLARGKPSLEQLALSDGLLTALAPGDTFAADGTDCRNYLGNPYGLPEARALLAPLLSVPPAQVLVDNNASLALMHDAIAYAMLHGTGGGAKPWAAQAAAEGPIAFICPSPGYDRHFLLCETFGIRMLPVAMTGQGPDMDAVERLAADPSVKGIWCIPKYSNPTGETYGPETVRRLAGMKTGAADFRIFWDNAYAVHHLSDRPDQLDDLLAAATRAGNPDRPLLFASTSKITFAGAGLSAFGASPGNLRWFAGWAGKRSIGPDKLNQLRHVRFLKDMAGIERLMAAHRDLMRPKFAAVDAALARLLGRGGVAAWTKPNGGYFVSLDVMDGCAKRVVALAKALGLELVEAGQTFPGGLDPRDRNIRLAPTFAPVADVARATEAMALCVLLAAGEAVLAGRGAA